MDMVRVRSAFAKSPRASRSKARCICCCHLSAFDGPLGGVAIWDVIWSLAVFRLVSPPVPTGTAPSNFELNTSRMLIRPALLIVRNSAPFCVSSGNARPQMWRLFADRELESILAMLNRDQIRINAQVIAAWNVAGYNDNAVGTPCGSADWE